MCDHCLLLEEDVQRLRFSLLLARTWARKAPQERRFEAAQHVREAETELAKAQAQLQDRRSTHDSSEPRLVNE